MRKNLKKELFDVEKNKECTYRPQLYKSKVKPNQKLRYSVYKKQQ